MKSNHIENSYVASSDLTSNREYRKTDQTPPSVALWKTWGLRLFLLDWFLSSENGS